MLETVWPLPRFLVKRCDLLSFSDEMLCNVYIVPHVSGVFCYDFLPFVPRNFQSLFSLFFHFLFSLKYQIVCLRISEAIFSIIYSKVLTNFHFALHMQRNSCTLFACSSASPKQLCCYQILLWIVCVCVYLASARIIKRKKSCFSSRATYEPKINVRAGRFDVWKKDREQQGNDVCVSVCSVVHLFKLPKKLFKRI